MPVLETTATPIATPAILTADAATYANFGPKLLTPLPGPQAAAIIARDEAILSPSYTRGYPLVVRRGRGTRIEDVDGNEFLDFSAGIAVTSTGHCHPEVVAAAQAQTAELIHMSGTDFFYEGMPQLAERLSAIAPMPGPHRVYFGNSGAEAVECALKLARYHTGRQNVIAFLGAFHGRTMGALSLTSSRPQQKRRFAPFVPGVTHVRYPYSLPRLLRRPPGRRSLRPRLRPLHRRQTLQNRPPARRSRRDRRRSHPGRRWLCRRPHNFHAGAPQNL